MSKIVDGLWDDISQEEKIKRWERVEKTLADMTQHRIDHHFDMKQWLSQTDCGTVGCAAGLCGINPWFKRRGFEYNLVTKNFTTPPYHFFGGVGYDRVFVNSFFQTTSTGRDRKPRPSHRMVLSAVRKYVRELKQS